MTDRHSMELTAVYTEDPNQGGFSAYFMEFPNIMAEGETIGEATNNLFDIASTVFDKWKRKEHLYLMTTYISLKEKETIPLLSGPYSLGLSDPNIITKLFILTVEKAHRG